MAYILVIDDDEQLRTFIRIVLEAEGFIVQDAHNGATGLASYHQVRPDLVLCDIFMPEKEGLETIVELCRLSPPVKIVAMSGGSTMTGSADFLPLAKRLGAATILAKPFDKGTLLRIVREAMYG